MVFRLLVVIVVVFGFSNALWGQAWKESVGFNKLVAEVGASLEDGTGVNAAFMEAPSSGNYMPDLADAEIVGHFFVEGSGPSGTNSHSNSVGRRFYGNTQSMTPGLGSQAINPITGFDANDWINNQLGAGTGNDPLTQNFHVSNHSYVGRLGADLTESQALDVLRRLDFAINQTEMTTVVGTSNSGSLPELMVQSYNSITVGRSDGVHGAGTTSAFYGAGRTKPDIVAPEGATSTATPIVASAAALLHEAGAGTNATRTEPMKAILLAGATKEEFGDWDRTMMRPLDEVYGAGELNVYNSYQILQGGETDGADGDPAVSVTGNGWDYEEEILGGDEKFYEFVVPENMKFDDLSIILTWNMEITDLDGSAVFDPSESLANMNLELFDSTGGFLNSLVDSSMSTVDNVEHIYLTDLAAGTYHLRVSSDTTSDYGLAWRSSLSAVPEPGSASLVAIFVGGMLLRRRKK